MKKYALPLALAIFTTSLQAQFRLLKNVDRIEIPVGVTSVSLNRPDGWDDSPEMKVGYIAGVGAAWSLNEKIAISTKLVIERKGVKFSSNLFYYDEAMQQHQGRYTYTSNLNYLSVPLSLKYHFDKSQSKGFSIEPGIYLSYLYKAQSISEFSWKRKEIQNEKHAFNEMDFGLHFIVGYAISISNDSSIKIWMNGIHGMLDVGNESGATGFLTARNQSIGFGLSYIKFR